MARSRGPRRPENNDNVLRLRSSRTQPSRPVLTVRFDEQANHLDSQELPGVRDGMAHYAPALGDSPSTVDSSLIALLFASAPTGCVLLNRDGKVIATTPALKFQKSNLSLTDLNVFSDDVATELGITHGVNRAFDGETVTLPTFSCDVWQLNNRQSGESRRVTLSILIFPLHGVDGRVERVAMTYRDDTEATLAKLRVQQQSEELKHYVALRTADLEAANEELDAYAYSVAHDLRSPLRTIDSFAAAVEGDEDSALSGKAHDSLQRIRRATTRMSELIGDLLSFSRLGKQPITLGTISPRQLIYQALQELEPKLRDRAIDIRIGELPTCHADPALIREVFLNLLDNAIKFTSKEPNARIEIGTRREGDQTVWFIADNGIGFDMDHYDRLFGVFSRLHSVDEFEGTGVGLALVSRIIKRHGGNIWAQAERGNGATFYFTLPLAR